MLNESPCPVEKGKDGRRETNMERIERVSDKKEGFRLQCHAVFFIPCIIHKKWRACSSHLFLPLFFLMSLSVEISTLRPRSNLLLKIMVQLNYFCLVSLSLLPYTFLMISREDGHPFPALVSWIPFLYHTLWMILNERVTAVFFFLSSSLFLAFRTTKKINCFPSLLSPSHIQNQRFKWDLFKAKPNGRRTKGIENRGSRRSIQSNHTKKKIILAVCLLSSRRTAQSSDTRNTIFVYFLFWLKQHGSFAISISLVSGQKGQEERPGDITHFIGLCSLLALSAPFFGSGYPMHVQQHEQHGLIDTKSNTKNTKGKKRTTQRILFFCSSKRHRHRHN